MLLDVLDVLDVLEVLSVTRENSRKTEIRIKNNTGIRCTSHFEEVFILSGTFILLGTWTWGTRPRHALDQESHGASFRDIVVVFSLER